MSDDRKQFTFFASYLDAIEDMPRKQKAEIILAIAEYALHGTIPALTGTMKTVFTLVKPTIDKGTARSNAIQKRWEKKQSNNTNAIQTVYKSDTNAIQKEETCDTNPSEERKGIGVGVGKDITPYSPPRGTGRLPAPRFVPPSVDDVRAYCEQRRNGVDPEQFVNFYASKGWKVGSSPMKDWKAAVRTWEQRDGRGPGTADKPKTNNPFLAMALEMEDEA